ncbi:MAG: hypothetical protein KDA77_11640, partial [Planctomycetaceae bacterium]|nr:hypothetical protein [Planctomycetaceae bacterium]
TVTKTHDWPVKFTVQEVKPAVTQQKHEIKQPFYPALTGSEQKIRAALQSKVDFEFPDVPLSKVLATLQSQHGVNIFLSAKALEDEGVTADHPVNIAMKGISLKSALELILKPLGLTYVVDDEVLKITTPYEANRTFQVRIYPVADLCETPEDFLVLQDVIRNAQLGNWKPNGIDKLAPSIGFDGRIVRADNYAYEGGTISVLPQIQSLVVSQNYDTHNAIVDFLSLLRDVRKDQQRLSSEKKETGIPR